MDRTLYQYQPDLHNYFLLWQNKIFFGFGQVKRSFQNKIFFGFCFGFAKAKNNCAGQLVRDKIAMLHTVNDIAAAFHLNQRETFCARRLFNVYKFLLCSLKGPLISAEAPEC